MPRRRTYPRLMDRGAISGERPSTLRATAVEARANMLAEKKKALEAAGFTPQQAMDILLADIAAPPRVHAR